ncbi:MAG: hypothetical protein H7A05_05935 [Pseudomonadales bacterium]|nr:hypothetical protein [Pseudomonadales bacterium]MCP5344141.1 hypothetical protein [Pseudomonadales bacterium]
MAITVEARTEIISLVVGMFGAAPGASVLSDLVASYEAGSTLPQIAASLANTDQFKSIYPTFLTNGEYATKVVNNLLAEASAEAKAEAVTVLTAELNGGMTRVAAMVAAINFVANSAASNTAYATSATAFDNKVDVAVYYSVDKELSGSSLEDLQAVIIDVTSAASSVTAAKAKADGDSTAGKVFVLTTGVDTITGTIGDDTFNADITVNATLSAADTITGGAGNDTLRIFDDASNAISLPVGMTGVENIYAHMGAIGESVNISSIADVTSLTVESANVGAAGANAALTYTVAAGQSLTLKSVLDTGNSGNDIDVASSSSVTSLSITLDGAGDTGTAADDLEIDVNGTGVATVNLATANNASNISLINSGAAIKTLNISGDKALTIRNSFDPAGTSGTIAATGMSGDLTFSAATANDAITFTGGSGKNSITTGSGADTLTGGDAADTLNAGTGNDTVSSGAGDDSVTVGAGQVNVNAGAGNDYVQVAGLDSTDVLTGGEGTDTLGLTFADADAADASTTAGSALRATYTAFEQLRVTDAISNTLSMSTLGFNYLQIGADVSDGGAGTSVAVNGFTTGATVEYRTAADMTDALDIGMTDAALSSDDVINIKLNADIANAAAHATKFGVTGINTVNVSAFDRVNGTATDDFGADDGYTIAISNAANMTALNITGTAALSYTLTAGTNAIKTIDASASTGNVTINVSAFAGTERVTIKGSQGVNTITGDDAAFGESITGGAKGDTITAGEGADAITGAGGRDAFVFADGDSDSAAMDKISDFGKVTVASTAAEVTAMSSIANFQSSTIGKGGDNADVLDVGTAAATLAGAQTATDVKAAISGGAGTETVTAVETAKGILTLGGADAGLINTLSEWIAVANTMAAANGDTVAFEFNGNTYVFQQESVGVDNVVELTGVTGVTGLVVIGSAVAAAANDVFVF